ncbi:ATP-binding protein [Neobacillus sp. YIM B06451]|uniref:ATP-binding protein n=1 Tax=Neobacillus sp. YIM B06451 TaxID=3070994 RepID=UPI00292F04BE|nr:ATP-binding protein [Neobacillus sp. YIM B06451]
MKRAGTMGKIKDTLLIYILMAAVVPIAGELKFFPFLGDLRVSLGTPSFFFILLWFRQSRPILAGLVTGISVVAFRIGLETLEPGNFMLEGALKLHFPVFFYYLAFAILFHIFKVKKHHDNPIYIGLFGVGAEIISTLAELFFRSFFSHTALTAKSFMIIVVIAFIRSFFVLGFYNIFIIREARLSEEQQRKRSEEILMMVSTLFVERIQLNKTMKNAEQLTAECYALYRSLKEEANQESAAGRALGIAGRMHEIKKDSQRIYAGLTRLMDHKNLKDFMDIGEILNVSITANGRYGESLGKTIQYKVKTEGDHPDYHAIIILSFLNNLISNAVEAIPSTGKIFVGVKKADGQLFIEVRDTGPGIPEKSRKLIFEPGFTTKFNESGLASNGIGLAFVKDTVEHMGGKIRLMDRNENDEYKTSFQISLPVRELTKRG